MLNRRKIKRIVEILRTQPLRELHWRLRNFLVAVEAMESQASKTIVVINCTLEIHDCRIGAVLRLVNDNCRIKVWNYTDAILYVDKFAEIVVGDKQRIVAAGGNAFAQLVLAVVLFGRQNGAIHHNHKRIEVCRTESPHHIGANRHFHIARVLYFNGIETSVSHRRNVHLEIQDYRSRQNAYLVILRLYILCREIELERIIQRLEVVLECRCRQFFHIEGISAKVYHYLFGNVVAFDRKIYSKIIALPYLQRIVFQVESKRCGHLEMLVVLHNSLGAFGNDCRLERNYQHKNQHDRSQIHQILDILLYLYCRQERYWRKFLDSLRDTCINKVASFGICIKQ